MGFEPPDPYGSTVFKCEYCPFRNPALYPLVPQGTEILTNLGYHYTGTYLIYSVLYRTVGWQFTVATICEIDGHRTYRLQAFTLLECSIRAKLHLA